MERKRHTPKQITVKLREAEGLLEQGGTVAEVCRQMGISEPTFYRWRNEYGGVKVEMARRLKALEQENVQLRRAVAELTLENLKLKEEMERPFEE